MMPRVQAEESRTDDPKVELARWLDRVQTLVSEVGGWARRAGWRTRTVRKRIDDRRLGRHHVDVLLMERDAVEVVLNPASPSVPGAEGAVDLYLAPAYDDIAGLYYHGGGWVIHYVFPSDPGCAASVNEAEALPLSEAVIIRVLDSISSHAA